MEAVLPDEMWFNIFRFLKSGSLMKVQLVCTRFYRIINKKNIKTNFSLIEGKIKCRLHSYIINRIGLKFNCNLKLLYIYYKNIYKQNEDKRCLDAPKGSFTYKHFINTNIPLSNFIN